MPLPGLSELVPQLEGGTQPLLWVGEHGYAIDDEEQEHGVRCVAVAVPDAPTRLGLSVSGPATRMTPEVIERTYPILREAAAALSRDLA